MNRLEFLKYLIPSTLALYACAKEKNTNSQKDLNLQLKFPTPEDYFVADCINPVLFDTNENNSNILVELFDSSQIKLLASGTGKNEVWLNIPKMEKNTELLLVLNGQLKQLVNVNTTKGQPVSIKKHLSALQEGKSIAITQTDGIPFALKMKNQNLFEAINMICTHNGCPINLKTDNSFVCTCHGSQFNSSGEVLNGPAIENLSHFTLNYLETNKIVIVNNYL
jgi:Rieske Fe-S protein